MTQRFFLCAASLLLLVACGGGGGGGSSASGGTPPTQPVPTSPIILRQGQYQVVKLQLAGTGPNYAQAVLVSQGGYAGAFTAASTDCGSVATFALSQNELTVTGSAVGSCTIVISDTFAQTATLPISVTTSGVTIQ